MTSATTQRKSRSLADLMDEQVKQGKLDPKDVNKPVDWRERSATTKPQQQNFQGGHSKKWDRGSTDNPSNSSLNWQQQELLQTQRQSGGGGRGGDRRQQGGFGGNNNHNNRQPFKAPPKSDLPEWATGLDNTASDNSLNWQQKSLMDRDESNPFSRLVRGEDEYAQE